jgi:hypothetical protein
MQPPWVVVPDIPPSRVVKGDVNQIQGWPLSTLPRRLAALQARSRSLPSPMAVRLPIAPWWGHFARAKANSAGRVLTARRPIGTRPPNHVLSRVALTEATASCATPVTVGAASHTPLVHSGFNLTERNSLGQSLRRCAAFLRQPRPSAERVAAAASAVLRRNEESRTYHWHQATGQYPPRRPWPGPRPSGG